MVTVPDGKYGLKDVIVNSTVSNRFVYLKTLQETMEIILFCSELDNICEYKKVFHVVSLEGTLTVPLTLAQSEMVTSTITLLSIINTRNIKPSNLLQYCINGFLKILSSGISYLHHN